MQHKPANRTQTNKRLLWRALALYLSGFAAFCLLWTIVPPPLALLWLLAVGASEWSLWFGLLGLAGAVLGMVSFGNQTTGAIKTTGILAVVLGIAAAGVSLLPLLQTLPVARANHVPLSLTRYLFAGGATEEASIRTETQIYTVAGGQALRVDIYRDSTLRADPPRPAIVVVHGGSWRAGTRSDFAHWDRWLAANGYAVFDIDYRLRPQPNWREATDDVRVAVAWVRQNAVRYNVDSRRVALMGRSAGGHLALLAGYTLQTPVQAVVSLYGPTDLAWGYTHPAVPDVIDGPGVLRAFLGGTPASAPEAYREASPVNFAERAHTPPTLLFHGERDLLVGPQHSRRLSAALDAAGVPHQAVYFPYALHGYDFHRDGWGGQVTQTVLLRFLHEHL